MRRTLTPDQFALAWDRIDGDRVPYPLAVRRSARDSAERASQLPALEAWCATALDADLTAALRVLTNPDIRVEVYGAAGPHPVRILAVAAGAVTVVAAQQPGPRPDRGADITLIAGTTKSLAARIVSLLPEVPAGTGPRLTAPAGQVRAATRPASGRTVPATGAPTGPITADPSAVPAAAGSPSATGLSAASEARGATGSSIPPECRGAAGTREAAGLSCATGLSEQVGTRAPARSPSPGGTRSSAGPSGSSENRRPAGQFAVHGQPSTTGPSGSAGPWGAPERPDVAGPTGVSAALGAAVPDEPPAVAAVRHLLARPRDGIGQLVVSARRDTGLLRPLAVLCWIDVAGDGRYTVHARTEVEIAPVTAAAFAARLQTPLAAAERITADTTRLRSAANW